ncbi:MAG: hypothetical protein HOW73_20400 [Polyangiaceae bacterium]|nr:hypothetical protein [Polyangiaceae bacterium]
MISVTIPIKLVSEANKASHEHWRARHRRAKCQKAAVAFVLNCHRRPKMPCVVSLTRVAPRGLDGDNYVGCFKAVRDAIATWNGVDDKDLGYFWNYLPAERGKPSEYAVRIEIRSVSLLELNELRAQERALQRALAGAGALVERGAGSRGARTKTSVKARGGRAGAES